MGTSPPFISRTSQQIRNSRTRSFNVTCQRTWRSFRICPDRKNHAPNHCMHCWCVNNAHPEPRIPPGPITLGLTAAGDATFGLFRFNSLTKSHADDTFLIKKSVILEATLHALNVMTLQVNKTINRCLFFQCNDILPTS